LQLAKKFGKKTILITSGEGGKDSEFDQVIQLPELDFSSKEFIDIAKMNLFNAVKSGIWNF
jgi:glycerate kinase